MPANQVSISNVIQVSVSTPQTGLGSYNTSNLALFSDEVYNSVTFGALGYKIYLDPTDVATDFGSSSKTYKMALAVFSQQPNILAGGGYLVIIPFVVAQQTLAFSGIAASGVFKINGSANINWSDTASQIQAKVQAVSGLEHVTVTGSIASQSLVVKFSGIYGPVSLVTISANTLATSAPVSITVTPTTTVVGETFAAAITRTVGLIQYFGLQATLIIGDSDTAAAAAVVQALNKIAFFVGNNQAADVDPGGRLDDLATAGFTQSRGLYYGDSDETTCLRFQAAYAGLALSTNFSGSNTTQTMNLKTLLGIQPDPSMTQTLLVICKAAGADIYASIEGVSKVLSFGANDFYDNIYNLQWFVGAIRVAGFNVLAQTLTKIPQTENGMDQLKGAMRQVCQQAVTNQFVAPGTWTNPTTFGNQPDFYLNISQRGYYLYSQPISQQLPADREDRKSPLVQIAVKYAGAIHTASVIIYVNP